MESKRNCKYRRCQLNKQNVKRTKDDLSKYRCYMRKWRRFVCALGKNIKLMSYSLNQTSRKNISKLFTFFDEPHVIAMVLKTSTVLKP